MEKTKKHVELDLKVPDGVSVVVKDNVVSVSGKKGSVSRAFMEPFINVGSKDGGVTIKSHSERYPYKKQLAVAGTIKAHIANMFRSASEGVTYKMKVVYSHFPMRAQVSGDKLIISNFLGEKSPRSAKIFAGVKVDVKGNDLVLTGVDKEKVAQTAANIEQTTRIKNRDPRVFQDGIYIIEKDGKPLVK